MYKVYLKRAGGVGAKKMWRHFAKFPKLGAICTPISRKC